MAGAMLQSEVCLPRRPGRLLVDHVFCQPHEFRLILSRSGSRVVSCHHAPDRQVVRDGTWKGLDQLDRHATMAGPAQTSDTVIDTCRASSSWCGSRLGCVCASASAKHTPLPTLRTHPWGLGPPLRKLANRHFSPGPGGVDRHRPSSARFRRIVAGADLWFSSLLGGCGQVGPSRST